MRSAIRTSRALWVAPRRRSPADHAYLAYAILMVGIVAVAPIVRGLWLLMTDPATAAALLTPIAATNTMLVVGAVWAVALLASRVRGPVVLDPFLAHVWGASPLPRRRVYARPMVVATIVAIAGGWVVGGLGAAAWAVQGSLTAAGGVGLIVGGGAVGVITVALWLVGQTLSARATGLIAALLAVSCVAGIAIPSLMMLSPLGWVGIIVATAGETPATIALPAVAGLCSSAMVLLLSRLDADRVVAQSRRWQSAITHASLLDLSASAAGYQTSPHTARRVFAVRRSRYFTATIIFRDVVGAARTPGRLVIGITALVSAGVLLGIAIAAAGWLWPLATAAGLAAYAAVGPLTDSIRHVAEAATALPLYGHHDTAMLAAHSVLPLLLGIAALTAGAVIAIVATGTPPTALLSAACLGASAVAARLMNALKPPLPIALLTPLPSPMGDFSVIARVAWATDAALLTAVAAIGAATLTTIPLVAIGGALLLAAVVSRRWVGR